MSSSIGYKNPFDDISNSSDIAHVLKNGRFVYRGDDSRLPFSAARKADGMLWLSGQIGNFPGTMTLAGNDITSQMTQAMDNIMAVLQQHQQPLQNYPQRLSRLRGLLQWQYSNSAAERRWQRQKQLRQTADVLAQLEQQMAALARQGNKTERLQQVQLRLGQLSSNQQQLNLALLSKQQQLLAELNQQLQQRLQQQLARLNDLQRHNKESMARVMERVLLQSGSNKNGASL